jgi:hypothetical protein
MNPESPSPTPLAIDLRRAYNTLREQALAETAKAAAETARVKALWPAVERARLAAKAAEEAEAPAKAEAKAKAAEFKPTTYRELRALRKVKRECYESANKAFEDAGGPEKIRQDTVYFRAGMKAAADSVAAPVEGEDWGLYHQRVGEAQTKFRNDWAARNNDSDQ